MPVRHRVLAMMFALTLVTYLDRVCIAATATAMQAELGLSRIEMGQILSAFIWGYVLFEIRLSPNSACMAVAVAAIQTRSR